ncbi:ankyrin repeat-containing domain protein [Mycena sp. CBHHK59/15]|nr:ankyrin repeat-containing domain protein [Mycena sp. CBHHK59/15]
MPRDYFEDLAPELIFLLALNLPTSSLNALVATCRRLQGILQSELDARITPALGKQLLLWAAVHKPHIVAKLLTPPYRIHPSEGWGFWAQTPLHVALRARSAEVVALLLAAGANPNAEWDQDEIRPIHMAVQNADLEMVKLLLDHGADIDARYGCDGCSENALHEACSRGQLDMVELLLDRGANLECGGHYGSALGFAVHECKLAVVRLLLERGANAAVTVPLFILMNGGPPYPHQADLLYIAMGFIHPRGNREIEWLERLQASGDIPKELPKWKGLPLQEGKKQLMAMLLAYGASKDVTLALVSTHLSTLARVVEYREDDFLTEVEGMLKELRMLYQVYCWLPRSEIAVESARRD